MTMESLDTSSDAMRSIMEKIEKLSRLANNNDNEHQAALALAKMNEYLTMYNLDIATIERHSGENGKREEQRIRGGMSVYQRNLWRAIAELNFCFYWTMKRYFYGEDRKKHRRSFTHEHKVIGRTVNVRSTQAMADYLEKTVDRLCMERLNGDNKQRYSAFAMSFREGIADRVIEKINERRYAMLDEERKKKHEAEKRATAAARKGVSTSTALTIADMVQAEEDGNRDFAHGLPPGTTAKERADWAAKTAQRAVERRKAEEAYTVWANAHPEEARAKAEKARKQQEAEDAKYAKRSRRWRAPKERGPSDRSAYYAGRDAGENVSIDPQVSGSSSHRRLK